MPDISVRKATTAVSARAAQVAGAAPVKVRPVEKAGRWVRGWWI